MIHYNSIFEWNFEQQVVIVVLLTWKITWFGKLMWKVEWKLKTFHVTIYFKSLNEKMINHTCVARDTIRKNGHMLFDILFEFLDLFNHIRYIFLLPHLEQHCVLHNPISNHCYITSIFKLSLYNLFCVSNIKHSNNKMTLWFGKTTY